MLNQKLMLIAVLGSAVGCTTTGGPARTAYQQPVGAKYAHQDLNWEQKLVRGMNPFKKSSPKPRPSLPSEKDPVALSSGEKHTPELYISMAEMGDRGGNPDYARQLYSRALSLDPGNQQALLGLARLEDRLDNLDGAMRIYREAVALHPNSATALNDLALCQARRGELQESLYLLQQASQLDPGKALYRNNLAKVLTEMNRLDDALAELSTVHPPAAARYNLGYMLHSRERSEEAAGYLRAALTIDPTMRPAQELLTAIESGYAGSLAKDGTAPQLDNSILPTPAEPSPTEEAQSGVPAFPDTGMPAHVGPEVAVPGVASQTAVGNPPHGSAINKPLSQ